MFWSVNFPKTHGLYKVYNYETGVMLKEQITYESEPFGPHLYYGPLQPDVARLDVYRARDADVLYVHSGRAEDGAHVLISTISGNVLFVDDLEGYELM